MNFSKTECLAPQAAPRSAWPCGPDVTVRPSEASALVFATDISTSIQRVPHLDAGPSLAGRLRGVIGRALELEHNPDRRTSFRAQLWDQPSAFDALFVSPMRVPSRRGALGAASLRPLRIIVSEKNGTIRITLRVFGRGRIFVPELRAALRYGLETLGLSLMPLSRSKARFPDVTITESDISAPEIPAEARLHHFVLISPVVALRGKSIALDGPMVGGSIMSHAASVLGWCGLWLDVSPSVVTKSREQIHITSENLSLTRIERWSNRQNKTIRHTGFVGSFSVDHVGELVRSLIPIAELSGLGSNTVMGFGQFRTYPLNQVPQ